MRNTAIILLAIFSFLSIGCDVVLQPAVQGEWSKMHNDKDKVSDARPHEEKPAAETK